ncbi:uncharacterized protein FPRO_15748 [Fusarium proliferatum ET1]|uniref:Uncharacterized protein n=1 Tax=Fusarium proliferatum (strain ET1) TaxID=1227346 RepID=A0A1L7VXE4_FUSPR|nr:uncharacterized protein FPRO_15748 [Fusarium proliferatum ET1]CZR45077.1 uncharacterized protein FPRO_15748 [Fusarium proliferatum ET1]
MAMPEPTKTKTWSIEAQGGSPRPAPPPIPSHTERPGIQEGEKKETQGEFLLGFGAQFESGKSKPASV